MTEAIKTDMSCHWKKQKKKMLSRGKISVSVKNESPINVCIASRIFTVHSLERGMETNERSLKVT